MHTKGLPFVCSELGDRVRQTSRPVGQPQVFGVFSQPCQCHCRIVFHVLISHSTCFPLLLQHDDIIGDFHKSGAKVIRFPGICKETARGSQNLICKRLKDRGIQA